MRARAQAGARRRPSPSCMHSISNAVSELAMGARSCRRWAMPLLLLACASRAECFAPLSGCIQQMLRNSVKVGVSRGRGLAAKPHTQVVCAADQGNKKGLRDIIEDESRKAGVVGFEENKRKSELSPEQVPSHAPLALGVPDRLSFTRKAFHGPPQRNQLPTTSTRTMHPRKLCPIPSRAHLSGGNCEEGIPDPPPPLPAGAACVDQHPP